MIPITTLLLCLPQVGTPPPSIAICRRAEDVEAPTLDGVLDEPFWQRAAVIKDLVQVLPVEGAEPSERSEILLAYDAENIYVGLRCFDRDPASIRATQMERDADLDPDDRVELLFDTFNDNRTGFWFQLSPAGSKGDALISRNGSDFNKPWDTIWYARTAITDEGWFGEIRLPFASLSFDPDNPNWGFNVRRFIRRRSEEARWAGAENRLRFFGPVNAGDLRGLRGLDQGLGLDFVPFFVGANQYPQEGGSSLEGDVGFDLFYKLSSNTKLSFSYNTDFAETEADSRQVNLSRFPLFFPEQRGFFLEDSGIFNFGNGGRRGSDVIPFFSRRIGLDGDGREVPLLFNSKITSTNDSYSFGLLDSQTEDSAGTPSRNLFAGRFSKNILEQSSVGLIYTSGDPTGARDDYTAGADLNLRTDEFLDGRSLRFRSFVLGTEDSETDGHNLAYAGSLEYPNDEVSTTLEYTVIEQNFSPALGFVRRTGIRRYEGDFSYSPRMYTNIRSLRFRVAPQLVTLSNGEVDSHQISITPLQINWESGEELSFRVTPRRTQLFEDFEISNPVTIPTGDYHFVRYGATFETSDKRPVSGEVSFFGGSFFDGERRDYEARTDWRLGSRAFLGLEYNYNDVHLAGGNFQVNLARLRADLHFSPRMSWKNFVQWDDDSESIGLNSRFRMIVDPGRDIFVVLNQGWSTVDNGFSPSSTDLRFKISYTFRF